MWSKTKGKSMKKKSEFSLMVSTLKRRAKASGQRVVTISKDEAKKLGMGPFSKDYAVRPIWITSAPRFCPGCGMDLACDVKATKNILKFARK